MEDDPLLADYRSTPMPFVIVSTGGDRSSANWGRYAELKVPLLAIHGTADTATDPTGSADLIDMAPSTDKRLMLVDGALHFILDDLESERVLQETRSWLDERTR
jgi:acylglycerol lipase